MTIDAAAFIRHIDACNNATLPGGRLRLRIGDAEIGYVLPEHAPATPLADRAAFADYVKTLRGAKAFRRRSEEFDVRDEATGAVIATVDRGAIPILGIPASGVHMNGLVRRGDGLHLWIGRRAADKRLDPNKLDQLTAGGVAAGHDPWSTLLKEGAEEASLPAELTATAREVGRLCYAMQRPEGLRRDKLYCYDLYLPDDFTPQPNDDEVAEFRLWPIAALVPMVAETDAFKFNVNLVLIDLFLRTGLIDPATAQGRLVDNAMQALRR